MTLIQFILIVIIQIDANLQQKSINIVMSFIIPCANNDWSPSITCLRINKMNLFCVIFVWLMCFSREYQAKRCQFKKCRSKICSLTPTCLGIYEWTRDVVQAKIRGRFLEGMEVILSREITSVKYYGPSPDICRYLIFQQPTLAVYFFYSDDRKVMCNAMTTMLQPFETVTVAETTPTVLTRMTTLADLAETTVSPPLETVTTMHTVVLSHAMTDTTPTVTQVLTHAESITTPTAAHKMTLAEMTETVVKTAGYAKYPDIVETDDTLVISISVPIACFTFVGTVIIIVWKWLTRRTNDNENDIELRHIAISPEHPSPALPPSPPLRRTQSQPALSPPTPVFPCLTPPLPLRRSQRHNRQPSRLADYYC